MKVERKTAEPAFVPIVITLETEEEANHLWHRLNNTGDWEKYCGRKGISINDGLDDAMWEALDEVFDPTDDC